MKIKTGLKGKHKYKLYTLKIQQNISYTFVVLEMFSFG